MARSASASARFVLDRLGYGCACTTQITESLPELEKAEAEYIGAPEAWGFDSDGLVQREKERAPASQWPWPACRLGPGTCSQCGVPDNKRR